MNAVPTSLRKASSPPDAGEGLRFVPRGPMKEYRFPAALASRGLKAFLALVFLAALATGCGGEDSSTSAGTPNGDSLGAQAPQDPAPPPPEPPSPPRNQPAPSQSPGPQPPSSSAPNPVPDLRYRPGVFAPSDGFRHFCADPSSAFDSESRQGSSSHERHWLRSWSHETYLWYDEIEDVDPTDDEHATRQYFNLMKTEGTTSSGARKDDHHFSQPTGEYRKSAESGVSAGYGVRFAVIKGSPPREVAVAYIEPGSPAATAGLARGARILEVDGTDVVNGAPAAINAGLYPSAVGEQHRFRVLDLGAAAPRSVSMTSAEVTRSPVQHVKVIETASGKRVGYFLFNNHILTAEGQLVSAVNSLREGEGIDDLVVDLRYNPGGRLFIASQLAFMIAGPTATDGKTFARLAHNDKLPDVVLPFFSTTTAEEPLPSLGLGRVFVLTGDGTAGVGTVRITPRTCSASESVINGLEGIDVEVIRVGSTTCGKPYGFYPADNCGTTYFTIQLQVQNDKDFGDYQAGFSPTCAVSGDDFDHGFGDPEEKLLKTALAYQADGACPSTEPEVRAAALRGASEETLSPGSVLKPPPLEMEGTVIGR